MKTRGSSNSATALLVALGVATTTLPALGQAPVISSLSQNGLLVCTNLQPGSTASVEWASSPVGPWTNNWAGLDAVTVDSNGMIQVSVPMFYRVRGIPLPPPGMALIRAGTFVMGDSLDGDTNALPLHTVQVSAFYMDRYEVTKVLWDDVYRWATNHGYSFDNAGSGKDTMHPVQTVSWYDCVKWCNARSEKEGRALAYYTDAAHTSVYRSGQTNVQNDWVKWDRGYRLPTEAEWEKAARGGASGHRFPWWDADSITHSRANYNVFISSGTNFYAYDISPTSGYHPTFNDGVEPYTSPVGYFEANGYALYDMAGNIYEWCWDWWGAYPSDPQIDPRGPSSGSRRKYRGGSWLRQAIVSRTASSFHRDPTYRLNDTGFRCVVPLAQ